MSVLNNSDEPVPEAYQIGWVPFVHAKIFLDSRPMIPRAETEYWTEKAIIEIKKKPAAHVLDLCAGSGAIGVAVLKDTDALVDFGELEPRHLPTIEKNIFENGIDVARIHVFQTDIWSGVTGKYDFILTNPPYLAQSRVDRIHPSVLAHEPHEALFADNDGFAHIQQIIEGAKDHLNPGGQLWIEHEPEHAIPILELVGKLGLTGMTHTDQYSTPRYSVILMA